ncbi:hypothetical protein GMDG_01055 [Pseudogymnoascus destructans 20631-21]|uniref:Signal peptidase complex subunit 3 n=1 Tax=Pseudogymnoascus destructans (strain ATCC MYA-4855 / 20631-21) TaxID=658429 RepID=L8FNH1_PSED2|nr:hypothetical protein GMDG_01055 [Pseudogymnoascus destructans 20631-21]
MHTSITRAQNAFGFFTTVAFVVALFVAGSDYLVARTPGAEVKVGSGGIRVTKGRPHYYSTKKEEHASIRFDLSADLSSLFTWNTKQVFVYVTAAWNETAGGAVAAPNEAVIWDTIITSPSADHLANLGKLAKRKLVESGRGKSVDAGRGIIKLRNQKPKYQITAPTGRVAQARGVTLRVRYNVQPWVGALAWDTEGEVGLWKPMRGGQSGEFDLPAVREKGGGEGLDVGFGGWGGKGGERGGWTGGVGFKRTGKEMYAILMMRGVLIVRD